MNGTKPIPRQRPGTGVEIPQGGPGVVQSVRTAQPYRTVREVLARGDRDRHCHAAIRCRHAEDTGRALRVPDMSQRQMNAPHHHR